MKRDPWWSVAADGPEATQLNEDLSSVADTLMRMLLLSSISGNSACHRCYLSVAGDVSGTILTGWPGGRLV